MYGVLKAEDLSRNLLKEIKECAKRQDLQRGKSLHSEAASQRCLLENIFVANALISMYSKCGSIVQARNIFAGMQNRDVVSWTALILGYVENGKSLIALDLFNNMTCEPNNVTFIAAFKACTGIATDEKLDTKTALKNALSIHRKAIQLGFDKDRAVANTMIDMYSKCGNMPYAREVFDKMSKKDVISWTALISGYVENGQSSVALDMFDNMDCTPNRVTFVAALRACTKLDGDACSTRGMSIHRQAEALGFVKDTMVANTLIDMYSKCRNMISARRVFDGLTRRDVVSLNILILGYVENGQSSVALHVFNNMDCSPDRVTLVGALKACVGLLTDSKVSKETCLNHCLGIHRLARERGFDKDTVVANTLINVYSKCDAMRHARELFDGMKPRTVVSWSALMIGYVENGQYSLAMDIFSNMNCTPNHVTFIAALRACSGLAAENKTDKEKCLRNGTAIHHQARELGLDKDLAVANTIMDMYTKCNNMVRAHGVFQEMKRRDVISWNILLLGYVDNGESSVALNQFTVMDCSPNHITYVAALRACACVGAFERGQTVNKDVCRLGLEPDEMVATCLIDFYGKCGKMTLAEEVFNCMGSPNSVSWTTLLGGYSLVGDAARVFDLVQQMKEASVQFDTVSMQMILTACSHSGKMEEGQRYFKSMISTYSVEPTVEHYTCMIDMLGRANRLEEALALTRGMPFVADSVVWTTLLAACKKWSNVEVGKIAFDALIELNEDNECITVAHVLMKSIYEKLGMVQGVTTKCT